MSVDEVQAADYFRIWQLRSRGWTESMISRFLGEPEWIGSGFGNLSGRAYLRRLVEDAEQTQDFEQAFLVSAKRRRLGDSEIAATLVRIRELRSGTDQVNSGLEAASYSCTGALNIGQEAHSDWLARQTPESMKDLANKAHGLLLSRRDSEAASSTETQFAEFDPIEEAMRRHPGLTREEAIEMAEAFGF